MKSNFYVLIFVGVCMSLGQTSAVYYSDPVCFVENSYLGFEQTNPDIGFDGMNGVDVVWSDDRSGYSQIFHRMIYNSGAVTHSIRADQVSDCTSYECSLDYPRAAYSVSGGVMICVGDLAHPYIESSRISYAAPPDDPEWFYAGNADPGVEGPFSQIAVAAGFTGSFMVHKYLDGLRLAYFNGSTWSPNDLIMTPPANFTYNNPDIAIDSDGYIYVVFDMHNPFTGERKPQVRRSIYANSIIDGFYGIRDVDASHYSDIIGHPAIYATGSPLSMDLVVAVAYIYPDLGNPMIYSICELNGPWASTPQPLIGVRQKVSSMSSSTTYHPDYPDIAMGLDDKIHVVWHDDRAGTRKVYGATAFGLMSPFLMDRLISSSGLPTEEASYPRTAFSLDRQDFAIAYQQRSDNNLFHVYIVDNQSLFFDGCDSATFENWTAHSGVDVDTFGRTGYGYRFRTNNIKGELIRDFGSEMTGSVEFWLYDTLSNMEDFYMRIEGNDGSKAGVYRMLGINNATTPTNYSVHDGTGWSDTGISRGGAGDWHHFIVYVSSLGIEMYIDPEDNPSPVHASSGFVSFNSIEMQGGSDTSPYFVDDIHVDADLIQFVPAMSLAGLMLTTLVIGFALRRKF